MSENAITLLHSAGTWSTVVWRENGYWLRRAATFQQVESAVAQGSFVFRPLERVIIQARLRSEQMLSFLSNLPKAFKGDVLFLERPDRAFLSATADDDARILYELGADDIEFYLDIYRLRADDVTGTCPVAANSTSLRAERMRVLIAEDETKMREYLVSVLQAAGCETIEARTGLEAIRATATQRPQVVLLDGLLPEMHGFEIARVIRALDPTYRPRIIMITGIYKNLRYQNEAKLKYQVDGYLTKPVTSDQIAAALFAEPSGTAVSEQIAS